MFIASVASGIGLISAVVVHTKWYYGGWMALFGDPPSSTPAYAHFVHSFETLPYVCAALAAGVISGFGYPEWRRILIRLVAIGALYIILASRNADFAIFAFAPISVCAFVISAVVSFAYFWLSKTK